MTKRNSRHAIHKYEGRRSLWARNPITIQVKSCVTNGLASEKMTFEYPHFMLSK